MLPHVDGLEICRRVRANEATAAIPIIMLTARAEESERIVGLELGADDYLAKPFSPNELVARVRALLRRAQPRTPPRRRAARLRADRRRYRAPHVSSRRTRRDADREGIPAARVLLQHRGRVLSRDVLLTDVWGYRYTGGTRTVDVHVRRLREKLPCSTDGLVTVKQFGYKLLEPAPYAMTPAAPTFQTQVVSRRAVGGGHRAGGRRRAVRDDDAQADSMRGSRRRWSPKRGSPRSCSDARGAAAGDRSPSSTRKPTASASCSARASRSSPRTAASSAIRPRRSPASPRWRTTLSGPKSSRRASTGSAGAPRYSATLNIDMLYVAVPVRHPAIAFVRVALPLTDVRQQLADGADRDADGARAGARWAARRIAWLFVGADRRARVAAIAGVARRYRARRPDAAAPRITATTSSGWSRGRSTSRCRRSAAGSAEQARDRGADGSDPRRHGRRRHRRRFAGAAAARERRGAADAEARRRRRSAGRTSKRIRHPAIAELVAAALRGTRRRTRCSCRRRAIHRGRSWRARRRRPAAARTASCWCCTTSPSCGARIRSAATSSPTSRTSCARR